MDRSVTIFFLILGSYFPNCGTELLKYKLLILRTYCQFSGSAWLNYDREFRELAKFGRGAYLAKFDIESAYRNVPVHVIDRHLLGMKWRSKYYVDLVLPFGLRSAPSIFNSTADSVEWILKTNNEIHDILHYLYHLVLIGPPEAANCAKKLSITTSIVNELGLTLNPNKCIDSATCMVVKR